MIQKEKLVQFYFSQYRDSAMALKKKNNDGKKTYEQRIGRLITEMQRTKTGKLTQPHLEEYHRQIRNMAYYALKQKNQYAIMQIRDILMPELVRLDIGTLREEPPCVFLCLRGKALNLLKPPADTRRVLFGSDPSRWS